MILRGFLPNSRDRSIDALYGGIVAQARLPAFYESFGVPDTVDGRFDLIVLHLVLVIDRLGRESATLRRMGQKLFDAFCRDLDGNLREMGVGDLAVPKRMRRFAEAFYGRQQVYEAALAAGDWRELETALIRNIYAETTAPSTGPARLAAYTIAAAEHLRGQELQAVLRGKVNFPDPAGIVGPSVGEANRA
jgi:cytochrome b pre-mRNA-processing protein 3